MKKRHSSTAAEIILSPMDIQSFWAQQRAKGLSPETLKSYAAALERLREFVGEGGEIGPGTLAAWVAKMQRDGYANSTINAHISAANGLLRFLHRSDLAADLLDWAPSPTPEITRGEYIRLLQTARLMGNARAYLLVKLLANTG